MNVETTQGNSERREDDADEDLTMTKKRRAYFRAVSCWSYPRNRRPTTAAPVPSVKDMPVVHPRPPHYHNQLFRTTRRCSVDGAEPLCHDDLDLSSTLPGVQGVEDSISSYEAAVGIQSTSDSLSSSRSACVREFQLVDKLDHLEVIVNAQRRAWVELVRSLLGGVLDHIDATHELSLIDQPPSDKALWDLSALDSPRPSRSSSSPEILDLTDSELSAESEPLPSTPKASKKSYARVAIGDQHQEKHSPIVLSPLPSKPLSASALTFIPSTSMVDAHRDQSSSSSLSKRDSSPAISPTYEFHFPSLNPKPSTSPSSPHEIAPPLSSTLQKDENGFYYPIAEQEGILQDNISPRTTPPRRASATFLPSFLADPAASARIRHTSKTREIVDRLRSMTTRESSGAPHKPRKPDVSHLRLSLSTPTSSADANSTADLAVTGGLVAEQTTIYESDNDGWITGISTRDAGSTVVRPVAKVDENGWIEGVIAETTRPKMHKRASSSISMTASSSSASASIGTFSSPPPPSSAGLSAGIPTTPLSGSIIPQSQLPYASSCSTAFSPFAPTGFTPATPAMAQAAYMQMQLQWQQAQAQAQAQVQAQWRLQMVQPHGLDLAPVYSSYAPYMGPPVMQGHPLGSMSVQPIAATVLQRTR